MTIKPLGRILTKPSCQPSDPCCSIGYELARFFQLDAEHCLVVVSRDQQGGGDLCVGNDGFIIRRLEDLHPEGAFPINRPDPNYPLRSRPGHAFLAKFPACGAFVPCHATLEDGTPHPARGTGYLISHGLTFNEQRSSSDAASEQVFEIIQLTWDGAKLEITSRDLVTSLGGYTLTGMGISNYWPQDRGFLTPFSTPQGTVVFRFEYDHASWRAAAHGQPFRNPNHGETEPSLVQGCDNHYYAFTRGDDPLGRLYRSHDGLHFELWSERANNTVPQVLNRAADGSLYLVTNPNQDMLRNPLVAYPVDLDGRFGEAIPIHDQDGARDAAGVNVPFVDHGIASEITLEGRPRHLLAYRVCDLRERTLHASQAEFSRAFHEDGVPGKRRSYGGVYLAEVTT